MNVQDVWSFGYYCRTDSVLFGLRLDLCTHTHTQEQHENCAMTSQYCPRGFGMDLPFGIQKELVTTTSKNTRSKSVQRCLVVDVVTVLTRVKGMNVKPRVKESLSSLNKAKEDI